MKWFPFVMYRVDLGGGEGTYGLLGGIRLGDVHLLSLGLVDFRSRHGE